MEMMAFHGVDHKVGTTMVSQSAAEMIARERKDLRVLFIMFCVSNGKEYVNEVGESIEELKLHLDNKILNKREVLKASKRTDNFYMIGGVGSLLEKRHYFPQAADYLLESLKEDVDLIIGDCGNDLDNGLALGALCKAHYRYLVLTQKESALRNYEQKKALYKISGVEFSSFVCNQYRERDPFSPGYLNQRLEITPRQFLTVRQAGYAIQAEAEYQTLLNYKEEGYLEDVMNLSNHILSTGKLGIIERKRKSKWKSFI